MTFIDDFKKMTKRTKETDNQIATAAVAAGDQTPAKPEPSTLAEPVAPTEPVVAVTAPEPTTTAAPITPTAPTTTSTITPVVPTEPITEPTPADTQEARLTALRVEIESANAARDANTPAPAEPTPVAPVAPVAPAPVEPIQFLTADEHTQLVDDPVVMNAKFNDVYQRGIADTKDLVTAQITDYKAGQAQFIQTAIAEELTFRDAMKEFFVANPDLRQSPNTIAKFAHKVGSEHNDWTLAQILTQTAVEARAELQLPIQTKPTLAGAEGVPIESIPAPSGVVTPIPPTTLQTGSASRRTEIPQAAPENDMSRNGQFKRMRAARLGQTA